MQMDSHCEQRILNRLLNKLYPDVRHRLNGISVVQAKKSILESVLPGAQMAQSRHTMHVHIHTHAVAVFQCSSSRQVAFFCSITYAVPSVCLSRL